MDEYLSFTEAAKILPKINGKRRHATTLWRWATSGVGGVRLRVARIGRTYVTTQAWLDAFFAELGSTGLPEVPSVAPSERRRRRGLERPTGGRELEERLRRAEASLRGAP